MQSNLHTRINLGFVKNMDEAVLQMNRYFDNKPKHTRDQTLSQEEHKKFGVWIASFGNEVARLGFRMFDGFIEEIKKIPNKKIAVVSTGAGSYVLAPSLASGLNPTHVLTYENHHSKEEKIEMVCRDWGVSVKDVYYFTDSKADVYELENLLDRGKIIGCSWGYCGYDKLRELLPENQILKDFKDVHGALKEVDLQG